MIHEPFKAIFKPSVYDYAQSHKLNSIQRKKPPWNSKDDNREPLAFCKPKKSSSMKFTKAVFDKILDFLHIHPKEDTFTKTDSRTIATKKPFKSAANEKKNFCTSKRKTLFCDMFTPREVHKGTNVPDFKVKNFVNSHNDSNNCNKTIDKELSVYSEQTPSLDKQISIYNPDFTPEKLPLVKQKSTSNISYFSNTGGKNIQFSWLIARSLIKLQMQPAELFSLYDVPWPLWKLQQIPTLGASSSSCRVQKMFKGVIPASSKYGKQPRVFIKAIPIQMWKKQWENQNKWLGNYVTDGENFVMEAAALAFLQQYAPHLAPRLLGILELYSSTIVKPENNRKPFSFGVNNNNILTPLRQTSRHAKDRVKEVSYIVIVSELYGEDLLDFFERREREQQPLSETEKTALQYDCLSLLKCLHNVGLAHLDFTPENILFGPQGLRLCDFAKATPLYTAHPRHIINKDLSLPNRLYIFESCEPTIGKGAYMPPECWKIYWELEDKRIQYPLTDLSNLKAPLERSPYYFRVDAADVYMAGVFLFWLWSEGGIWKCSDEKQDKKFHYLVNSNINFSLFRECKNWPPQLKQLLRLALNPNPRCRATLEVLMESEWFDNIKFCNPR